MLYSEKVMDHFQNPRNVGKMDDADGVGEVGNAKCGDIMKMYIKVKDGIITFADGYHEHIDALDKAAEQEVRCSIRPEEFIICKDGTDGIHGTVQECTYLGLNTHYTIDTDQGDSVEIVEESSIGEGLKKGEKVLLKVKKEKINVFTKDGGTNLIRSDAYEKQ